VVIETTGLADPSPIAHTFMASDLADKLRLDGIVTVVDARHLEKELNDGPEPRVQIAFADVILLNKTDLVSPQELAGVESRIRSMNPLAQIHRTQQSQIEIAKILNVKARELSTPLTIFKEPAAHDHDHDHAHGHDHKCDEHCDHDHDHKHDHDHAHEEPHHHHHDESVRSFYIEEERPLDLKKLEVWLGELLKTLGADIYRSKGVLHIKGQPKRVVFQGVQMMFDSTPDRFWNPTEKRQSQLVFIGKDLDEAKIRTGFQQCLAS
jgi:G3E family GTPase